MLSSLEFRMTVISKRQIPLRTPCLKFCLIMVVLKRKLQVNIEYTMLTLIWIATIDQPEGIVHDG